MFSLFWFHRNLVATDPVLVLFSMGQHEVVALLLFFSSIGACCDTSEKDLVVSIKCRWRSTSIGFRTQRTRST